jgi:hypothetical protein
VWSKVKIYEDTIDPLINEALALRDGCVFAVDRGFTRLIFEVDSAKLVKLWHYRLTDRSMIRPILDDISELCKLFLFLILRIVFAIHQDNTDKAGAIGGGSGGATARGGARGRRERGERAARGGGAGARR